MASVQVSVLMPVFNASSFLEACLESICAQAYQNWELLAVDDFSTDDSLDILKRYAQSDDRIHVFSNTEKGIIPALRLAYTNSKGRFITRMDADDLMPKDKLLVMSQALTEVGAGHLVTGKVAYFSDTGLQDGYRRYADWLNSLVDQQNHWTEIFRECVIPSPAWMITRNDLDVCGAFEPNNYPEDYDLVFRFFQHGLQVVGLDHLVHHWRDHQSRTSRTDDTYALNAYFGIKIQYLQSLKLLDSKTIILWGAGRKGKDLAQRLIDQTLDFQWTCNVPSKWGHTIYGQHMQKPQEVLQYENPLVLIAVSGPADQIALEEELIQVGLIKGESYYFFC